MQPRAFGKVVLAGSILREEGGQRGSLRISGDEKTRFHVSEQRLARIQLPGYCTLEVVSLRDEPIARYRGDQHAVLIPRQAAEPKRQQAIARVTDKCLARSELHRPWPDWGDKAWRNAASMRIAWMSWVSLRTNARSCSSRTSLRKCSAIWLVSLSACLGVSRTMKSAGPRLISTK